MKLGLIGEKLSHSYSKRIFEEFLGYPSYDLIELKREELASFCANTDLDAFNVTVPYKTEIIPFLKDIDSKAKRIGAVNAVRRKADGLYGTNTDYDGLAILLLRYGIPIDGKKILILGTGGTSKTAEAVCTDLGAKEIVKVSRQKKDGAISYEEAPFVGGQVMINTTPVGMFPNTQESTVDLRAYPDICAVADVVYNPLRTALVQQATDLGIQAVSGLLMLTAQATSAEAFFFPEKKIPDPRVYVNAAIIEYKLRRKTQNLVLVGMPSVGKTTVGKLLAQKLNRPFYDTDTELEKRVGAIPDFIRVNGEEAFRKAESEWIAELTKTARGAVIATGGGAVLREENRRALRENGRVILLEREVDAITFDASRPLSDTREKWLALWKTREPIYRAFADLTVSGFQTPEEAYDRIMEG